MEGDTETEPDRTDHCGSDSGHWTPDNPKCPKCGRFCSVGVREFGDSGFGEVPSCDYCGLNPPTCSKETGTVYGCQSNSTHEVEGRSYGRYWCEDHAPAEAVPLPYVARRKNQPRGQPVSDQNA